MSAVRARVDQHHGTISVESQPQAGTTWRLAFPLTELASHETVGGSEVEPERARSQG
jgi:nitrogen-specific signal transduction histidine kinase